jgi:hypothetical protein
VVPSPLALSILNVSLIAHASISPRRQCNHQSLAQEVAAMRSIILSIPLLVAVSVCALAANPTSDNASNINGQDTLSPIAPALPEPNLAEGARPSDALRAAQGALAAGRTGEAQAALEMAETRMLDRSVALGATGNPSDNPTVGQISRALQALAANDRATSMQWIQTALGSATAQGL